MNGDKSPSVRTNKKEGKGRKSAASRHRPRIHITLSQEVYDWLHSNVSNISKFIEQLIIASKEQIEPAFVLISRMHGPGGIRTLDRPVMSRTL